MSRKANPRRPQVEDLLVPAGGARFFAEHCRGSAADSRRRHVAYSLLSSISSAILERDADHKRSTVRSDSSSAAAVSAVVKPAK